MLEETRNVKQTSTIQNIDQPKKVDFPPFFESNSYCILQSIVIKQRLNKSMQNQQSINLETLRQSIALTNSDLNELAHNHQKFVGTIRKFNNQAKAKINADSPKEALVYLTQAEKVLEYAASCGKNIDRNMIVCVLHNEACCYQKLWELQKCSNYLEALIFNISSHLKTSTPSPREVQDYIKTSGSLSSHLRDSLYGKPINQRIQLSKYHLQFCAINSQLRNHKGALISGKRAIAIIKDIFQELQTLSIEKSTIQNNYSPASMYPQEPQQDYQTKLHLITGIATINDEPNINRLEDYITTAKFYFRKWNIRKHEQNNEAIKESLKNFSIGSIMQIRPVGFDQSRDTTMDNDYVMNAIYEEKYHTDLLKTENLQKVIHHALLLTIGYFTIATQLRLISSEKYRTCEETRKKSSEYIQSQIYHIISMIVTSIYVPYDMVYMRHILTSFSNHYNGNLNEGLGKQQEQTRVMSKQFDPCSFCEGKKKKGAKKQGSMNTNRSIALQIVDSIRVGEKNMGLKDANSGDIHSGKASLKKNKSQSKSKSKNKKNQDLKCMKKSKSKHRVNSEQLIKIQDGGQTKRAPQTQENKKFFQKKQKIKSQSQRTRKSTSRNNSKNKKSAKKIQENDKPKHQYYKYRRHLQKSKSPRSTAKKNQHRQVGQRSDQNIQNIRTEKGLVKSGHSGSIKLDKKKITPLKKNLDKYYF